MSLQVEVFGNKAVVVLAIDKLDAANAGHLRTEMCDVFQTYDDVVLDMSQVDFVDSSGLGVLLSFTRMLASKGGRLRLCAVKDSVLELIRLVRFERVLDIALSREEALESL
jgi:anti-sigma B factor antagonist